MFRIGDKVWNFKYGWGEVVKLDNEDNTIEVKFKEAFVWFTLDGKGIYGSYRSLFFDEIPIPESALERPRKSAKEMLDECEQLKFETGEDNFYVYFDTIDSTVRFGKTSYNFIYGLKFISEEDTKRIVTECKENNKG